MTQTKTLRFVIGIAAVLLLLGVVMAGAVSADESSAVGSEDVKTVSTTDGGNVNVASASVLIPLNGGVSIIITDENGLRDALEGKGAEVTLGADIVLSEPIEIKRSISINLNGHSLKSKTYDNKIFTISSGYLVLKDTSSKNSSLLFMSGDSVYAVKNGYSKKFDTVMDESSLKEAVEAGGNVILGATITMNSQLDIKNNVVLDLNGCELIFKDDNHIYVYPNKELTINDRSNPSTGKVRGGFSSGSGGGIFVGSGGKLTLNQGTIEDSEARNDGAGVYVDHGTFIMNGGAIIRTTGIFAFVVGDNGGGVYMNGGTFEMYGGEISGYRGLHGGGSGVYVKDGTFTMSGGVISDNSCEGSGGGVYVDNSTFTMSGGEISDNSCDGSGGGVYVENSTFTMEGGSISNNRASGYGGGVCVEEDGVFTMIDGSISDNSSTFEDGAGVCVFKGGKFIMKDGTIEKNTARGCSLFKSYGGGVYVRGGEFEMSGGIIQENTVENDGGGVFVCENGTMSVSGDATITGNMKKDGKEVANLGLDSGGTLTLDGNLTGEIRICSPNPQEGTEFGIATSGVSGAENILSDDGNLCGKIDGGKLVWTNIDILRINDDYNFILGKGNEGGSSSLSGALTTDITTTTTAKTPVPVLGILAGLGVAALFLRRR